MKIGIICGSNRSGSQSGKIARHVENELLRQKRCDETWLFDLADNPLPLWEQGVKNGDAQWQQRLAPLSEELKSCDGFVIVSPEWNGMAPAGLKNFFLMWSTGGELAHKPALIIAVSAAVGGSYPIAELRMSSYKNCRICYLPEHLIVRYVGKVFNDKPEENDAEAQAYLEGRLAYCLDLLREYTGAFRRIRSSGKVSLETYINGM